MKTGLWQRQIKPFYPVGAHWFEEWRAAARFIAKDIPAHLAAAWLQTSNDEVSSPPKTNRVAKSLRLKGKLACAVYYSAATHCFASASWES